MNGYKDPEQIRAGLRRSNDYCVSHPPPPVTWPVPDSVNWTAEGVVVEPRNQVSPLIRSEDKSTIMIDLI